MANKTIFDTLTDCRVKVERDGKEIVNVPGILAFPAALFAPKASIIGTVAASLLGCSIHLESADGKGIDIGKAVKDSADTVADTAKTVARSIKEEVDKAWDALSADDPEGCPIGEENEPEAGTAEEEQPKEGNDGTTVEEIVEDLEKHEADDIPTIHVEKPYRPE